MQDFELKLRAPEYELKFIDTSGIPNNIKFALEDDEIFHSSIGGTSDGLKVGGIAPFAFFALIMAVLAVLA